MKNATCFLILITVVYGASDQEIISRFLQYRTFTRITEKQVDVSELAARLCRDPSGVTLYGPHVKPGVHIYANKAVLEEAKKDPSARNFPIGAVLVKEKFEVKEGTVPSVITVMEKIASKGSVYDWQFYMIRLSDRTIVREGFTASCSDCHSHFKADFVSRETNALLSAYAKK